MNLLPNKKMAKDTETGEYALPRNRRANVIAAIVCLLLALAVWVLVMNAEDSNYVPVTLRDAPEGYECVLSDSVIEVQGSVHYLKMADAVEVIFPEDITGPGTYQLELEDLVLPEGVSLKGGMNLTLTVTRK